MRWGSGRLVINEPGHGAAVFRLKSLVRDVIPREGQTRKADAAAMRRQRKLAGGGARGRASGAPVTSS